MARLDALAVNNLVTRRVVLGRGQPQRRTLLSGQRQNLLHRPLTECLLANDLCALEILHAAGNDLRGAGAVAIDQHYQRQFRSCTAARRFMLRVFPLATTLGRHDQFTLGQKLFAHLHGLVKETAGVVAQVKHQSLHFLQLKFF